MTRSKKPRRKPDPEALLAKLREIDVDVARTLRTDIARMHTAAARSYLAGKLRELRAGTYRRPFWLLPEATAC